MRTTKKVEDSQQFSLIIARVGHPKEGMSKQNNIRDKI